MRETAIEAEYHLGLMNVNRGNRGRVSVFYLPLVEDCTSQEYELCPWGSAGELRRALNVRTELPPQLAMFLEFAELLFFNFSRSSRGHHVVAKKLNSELQNPSDSGSRIRDRGRPRSIPSSSTG